MKDNFMLTRRSAMGAMGAAAGLAGAPTRLIGAAAAPPTTPKYYHISQSSVNYGAEFRAGKMDFFSFMDLCRRLDQDGLDIHVAQLKSQLDLAYLKEVRRGCVDRGLPIASICVSTEFGRNAANVPAEIEKTRVAMEAGMFLGAPVIRVFVGSPPSPETREEAYKRGVEALRKTTEIGAKLGMTVMLQNHSGLTSTGDDMLRFLKDVDHPNFTLLLDTGHFAGRDGTNGPKIPGATYDDFYRSIEQVANVHPPFVRVKFYTPDATGREQWIDYDRVINILRKVNYNGFLSVIYEGKEDKTTAIPRCIAFMRSYTSR